MAQRPIADIFKRLESFELDILIRKLEAEEYPVLRKFLYLSIFVPEGEKPAPVDLLDTPEFQVYLNGFGQEPDDIAVAADSGGRIVGAAWARVMNDYGHFYDGVPSLAISLLPEYRGMGLGKRLLSGLLEQVRSIGHDRITLSVQKENHRACNLYRSLGFHPVHENDEEFIMLNTLI